MSAGAFTFPTPPSLAEFQPLRDEVRAFLQPYREHWSAHTVGQSWVSFDREFSRAVGAKGWIGMTWPKEYGGGERSWQERYVVLEELLAAGAPIGAHMMGDRQTGPLLLRIGTDEQKRQYLPPLARGEISACIGLSEPDSGSDLASLRTTAEPSPQGWLLNGRKIWTTNAHKSEYMLALVRTGGPDSRHAGLSQFMVDLALPGVTIRPIRDLSGEEHFNEVTFDDVQLAPNALVGTEGAGWTQATAELAFERSGPDRFLSNFPLLEMLHRHAGSPTAPHASRMIGSAAIELMTLREMSLSIAKLLSAGGTPGQAAALVKELGTTFEQSVPDRVRAVVPSLDSVDGLADLLDAVECIAPTYSLRGGTREILVGLIVKGLQGK